MKYREIKLETGVRAPSSTIQGIKKLLMKGKNLGEKFTCLCPNGNLHIWNIIQDRTHVCVGSAPRKKAARVGKGINKHHFQASLKTIKYV